MRGISIFSVMGIVMSFGLNCNFFSWIFTGVKVMKDVVFDFVGKEYSLVGLFL